MRQQWCPGRFSSPPQKRPGNEARVYVPGRPAGVDLVTKNMRRNASVYTRVRIATDSDVRAHGPMDMACRSSPRENQGQATVKRRGTGVPATSMLGLQVIENGNEGCSSLRDI